MKRFFTYHEKLFFLASIRGANGCVAQVGDTIYHIWDDVVALDVRDWTFQVIKVSTSSFSGAMFQAGNPCSLWVKLLRTY